MATDVKGDRAFYDRIQSIVHDASINTGLALGSQLGLFKAITQLKQPFTPEDLAKASDCKTLYIRQWLLLLTASDIIEMVDSEAKTFRLAPERFAALTSQLSAVQHSSPYVAFYSSKVPELTKVFQTDGPKSVSDWGYMTELWQKGRKTVFETILKPIIRQIPGLEEKLEVGARVLDMGCNRGVLCYLIADFYPKCVITGADPDKDAIEAAWKDVQTSGSKINFEVQNAMKLPEDWSNQFDYVITVNALHHFEDAAKGMGEIFRVLKPLGWFSGIEFNIDADVSRMVKQKGSVAHYCFELLMKGKHAPSDEFDHKMEGDHHHGDGGHHHGDEGHHHGDGGHHHHHHGPTDFQRMTKAIEDGGFKDVKKLEIPQVEFMEEIHLHAQKL
ncbi:hypothetical protein CAPTEDRAFT_222527 [Capitella teleta]|uniref:Uncharacterized protein n=1 Tax=Capitella teleta TaxID=283909 RepID=R7VH34_CAPTE|nr:hypothetical protein CAPTEDRAFT_222527 [Capitella teleta]|eukprot:ELU17924.1 hypothetical protein CAPTEDRAFT_222527 [Capitella teleta]